MCTETNLERVELSLAEGIAQFPQVVDVEELYTPGDIGSRALVTFDDGSKVQVRDMSCTGGSPAVLEKFIGDVLNYGIPEDISTPKDVIQLEPSWEHTNSYGRVHIDSYGVLTLGAVDPETGVCPFTLDAELPDERYNIYRTRDHVIKMLEALRVRYVPTTGIWIAPITGNRSLQREATYILSPDNGFYTSRKVCFRAPGFPKITDGVHFSYPIINSAAQARFHYLTDPLGIFAILPSELSRKEAKERWACFNHTLQIEELTWERTWEHVKEIQQLYAQIVLGEDQF